MSLLKEKLLKEKLLHEATALLTMTAVSVFPEVTVTFTSVAPAHGGEAHLAQKEVDYTPNITEILNNDVAAAAVTLVPAEMVPLTTVTPAQVGEALHAENRCTPS